MTAQQPSKNAAKAQRLRRFMGASVRTLGRIASKNATQGVTAGGCRKSLLRAEGEMLSGYKRFRLRRSGRIARRRSGREFQSRDREPVATTFRQTAWRSVQLRQLLRVEGTCR